jgi:Integral membrane protein S linking to the trans Golgi network
MKKVVDFGLTLYFWHGVTVLAYSVRAARRDGGRGARSAVEGGRWGRWGWGVCAQGSFPWSWTWGVVQVLSAATTVALGMYLCFQSELQPISVQDVLRRDEERKRSRSMDRGAGASASGGAGASAATATSSSSATSVAANGSGGAGLAASSSTATLRSTSAGSGAASSGNRTPTPGSPGRSPKLLGSPVVHHAVLDAALDALSSSSSAPGGSPVVQTNLLAPHNVFGEAAPLPLSTPTKLLGGVAAAHGRIRSTGASPVQAPIAAAPPSAVPAGGAASSTDPSALGLPPRARSGRRLEP